MRLLQALGVLVALLFLAAGVMAAMGSRLPHDHVAKASVLIHAPRARVWKLIDDNATQPAWRSHLKSVAALPPRNGHPCWQELNSMGRMPMCEDQAQAPRLRVVSIADPGLPFGGQWVYELEPADGGAATQLTVTEYGTTGPALWRFLGHYVFHEDTTIKQFEQELQRAAGNPAVL